MLQKGEAFQLKIYADVLNTDTTGYFLMRSNSILMNQDGFKEAETVLPEKSDEEDSAEKILDTLIKEGHQPKWDDDACKYCPYGFLCGVEKKKKGK